VHANEKSRKPGDTTFGNVYLDKLSTPDFFQIGGYKTTDRGLMDVILCKTNSSCPLMQKFT
jgi:CRISPR/Cas system CMR subunit Cmr4 (Cas7 group RAMP superfamily)